MIQQIIHWFGIGWLNPGIKPAQENGFVYNLFVCTTMCVDMRFMERIEIVIISEEFCID